MSDVSKQVIGDEPESPERRRARLGLERQTMELGRTIAQVVKTECGPQTGFLLVMFDFGAEGSMAYCSNGVRRDIVQMLDELRGKLAAGWPE